MRRNLNILYFSAIFLLSLPIVHSPAVRGETNASVTQEYLSADSIASMEIEQLEQLWNKIERLKVNADMLIGRGPVAAMGKSKVIQDLRNIEVEETADLILNILNSEVKRPFNPKLKGDPQGPDLQVISECLDALKGFATQHEVNIEEGKVRFENIHNDVQRVLLQSSFSGALGMFLPNQLSRTKSAMLERGKPLPSLALLVHGSAVSDGGIEYLTRVENSLREQIFEDESVIQRLMEMVGDSFLDGPSNRKVPDKLYLLGSSGTGKTNAAQALTNALHQDPEAWKTHMFRLPVLRNPYDEAQVMGATVGLLGSDKFPAFLKFLERHSDGKYLMVSETRQNQGTIYKLVLNPEYEGKTLPGFFPPWKAVIFIDEFHDVSAQQKSGFYKLPIEDGTFTLPSPNGGEHQVTVPANIIVASNEGADLIAGRDITEGGATPQTYEQLKRRWDAVQGDQKALLDAILATNQRGANGGQSAPGTPPEVANRFAGALHLMEPASPKRLQIIAEDMLVKLSQKLSSPDSLLAKVLGSTTFTWEDDTAKKIQEYDYNPELMARPVKERFKDMIRKPLLAALREEKFKTSKASTVHVAIKENNDHSKSLLVKVTPAAGEGAPYSFEQLITLTTKDLKKPPISDDRIDQVLGLSDTLRSRIFGMDDTVKKITDWIIQIENEMNSGQVGPVNVMLIDGLSSTGKSQLAKELHRALANPGEELPVFDFSKIRSEHDVRQEILGYMKGDQPVKSRFMKLYDYNQGRIVVEFGEMANSDPNVLKLLYSLFRDNYVEFADGIKRPMNKVTILVTGNSTLKEYSKVPMNLPLHVRMAAYQAIYQKLKNNYELFLASLSKDYPLPLINRFGAVNVVVSRPHTYKSLRELAQLKVQEAIDSLKTSDESKRGWDVVFANVSEYKQFIDTVIEEGFRLDEQGASIDNYIKAFRQAMNGLLLREKAATGSQIVLQFHGDTDNRNKDLHGKTIYDVFIAGHSEPAQLALERPYVEPDLEPNDVETILTGWHEAGHDVVNRALFGDAYAPVKISIVPGVEVINGEWIFYEGVAVRDHMKRVPYNREFMIRTMATLLAGHVAEVYASGDHSAGKANDIERAKLYAREAILRLGLEEEWGIDPIPMGMKVEDHIAHLTDDAKLRLQKLQKQMLLEAENLAEQTILANAGIMQKLANKLIESRELNKQQLTEFYQENSVVGPAESMSVKEWISGLRNAKMPQLRHQFPRTLMPGIERPTKIADLKGFLDAQKQAQFDQVPLPDKLPIVTDGRVFSTSKSSRSVAEGMSKRGTSSVSCADLLTTTTRQ